MKPNTPPYGPDDAKLVFGGSLLGPTTNPKTKRPIDRSLPLHLVLRAKRSTMRTPKNFGAVNALVTDVSRKWRLRLHEYANVGNHLHLLVKAPDRAAYVRFIRELTGRIARLTGVAWAHRPFTRVVRDWGRAYRAAEAYVALNRFEANRRLNKLDAEALRRLRRS